MFELKGTAEQRTLIGQAIGRTQFQWHWLFRGLLADTGRDAIPVEWEDLGRYNETFTEALEQGKHAHVHEHKTGDKGDPVMRDVQGRMAVLGLAWYSGKITLDNSLSWQPDLAAEVFLSEVAHMVDFFYMSDLQRVAVYNAFHPIDQDLGLDIVIEDGVDYGHGHGWFDVGGYYSFVGEAFMGGFVKAFSDVPVTINFDHPPTVEAVNEIRKILQDPAYFASKGSRRFHDNHKRIGIWDTWRTREEAMADGFIPCTICDP